MKRLGPDVWDDENEEPIRKIGDQTLIEDEKLNELQRMVDEGNARFKDDGSRYTLPDAETIKILNRLTKVNPEPEVKRVETIKKIAQQKKLPDQSLLPFETFCVSQPTFISGSGIRNKRKK
jgi:hypothetical protein